MRETMTGSGARSTRTLIVIASAVFGLSGCVSYGPQYNSSGAFFAATLPSDKYTILGPTEGKTCAYYFAGIFVGGEGNTGQAAIKEALQERGGDQLVIMASDHAHYGVPFLFWRRCAMVYGTALKYVGSPAASAAGANPGVTPTAVSRTSQSENEAERDERRADEQRQASDAPGKAPRTEDEALAAALGSLSRSIENVEDAWSIADKRKAAASEAMWQSYGDAIQGLRQSIGRLRDALPDINRPHEAVSARAWEPFATALSEGRAAVSALSGDGPPAGPHTNMPAEKQEGMPTLPALTDEVRAMDVLLQGVPLKTLMGPARLTGLCLHPIGPITVWERPYFQGRRLGALRGSVGLLGAQHGWVLIEFQQRLGWVEEATTRALPCGHVKPS